MRSSSSLEVVIIYSYELSNKNLKRKREGIDWDEATIPRRNSLQVVEVSAASQRTNTNTNGIKWQVPAAR